MIELKKLLLYTFFCMSRHKIKTWVILILTIICYTISTLSLFVFDDFLIAAGWSLLLYALMHLYTLESRFLTTREHIYVFLWLSIVWWLFLFPSWRYLLFSILFYHAMLRWTVFIVRDELDNRRIISTWSLIHSGWYIFTLLITATFSLWGMATFREFNLTCNDISTYSNDFVEKAASPLTLWYEQITKAQNSVSSFLDTSVNEALWVSNTEVENAKKRVEQKEKNTWLLWWFELQKARIIDQVIEQKETVDDGICEVMITTIKKQYNTQNYIQYSVIVLMLLLLSPFVRIVILVWSTILWLLLRFLIKTNVYKITKEEKYVEDLT